MMIQVDKLQLLINIDLQGGEPNTSRYKYIQVDKKHPSWDKIVVKHINMNS